jgi:WNK lysine deficient protein kinase
MYKTRVGACVDGAKAQLGYVETDPSGRYGRGSQFLA